jgi:uncharacterized protein YeeX (DUF496 family)
MENEYQEEAKTDLEIALESNIENCLSEGISMDEIKRIIKTMTNKFDAEIAKMDEVYKEPYHVLCLKCQDTYDLHSDHHVCNL